MTLAIDMSDSLPDDPVLLLREARRSRGLSQKDVARLAGVGEKTISSFETGQRIKSLKVEHLLKILRVYGLTPTKFFSGDVYPTTAEKVTIRGVRTRTDYQLLLNRWFDQAKADGLQPQTLTEILYATVIRQGGPR